MKRLLYIVLIITLVFSFNLQGVCFADSSFENIVIPQNDEIFNNYLKILDGYKKEIGLLAKNIIEVKKQNDKNKTNDFLKNINFLKVRITETMKDVDKSYKSITGDEKTLDHLLAVGIILIQYKFALTQLSYLLNSDNPDDNFNQLDLFFGFYNDSNKKINCLKNNCIAW